MPKNRIGMRIERDGDDTRNDQALSEVEVAQVRPRRTNVGQRLRGDLATGWSTQSGTAGQPPPAYPPLHDVGDNYASRAELKGHVSRDTQL